MALLQRIGGMPASKYRVIIPRCEVVQVESFESPFAGLEFCTGHGFVVRRTYAVPRQAVWVVIVSRTQYALLVADGEVVKYDKLVGVVGEVGIEITVAKAVFYSPIEPYVNVLQLEE